MEKILLHIAAVGTKSTARVGGELTRRSIATVSHCQKNAMNPGINRHAVEPFVGKEQNAIRNFHANSREGLQRLTQTSRGLRGDGVEIEFSGIEHLRGFEKIRSAVAESAIAEIGFASAGKNGKMRVGIDAGAIDGSSEFFPNGEGHSANVRDLFHRARNESGDALPAWLAKNPHAATGGE